VIVAVSAFTSILAALCFLKDSPGAAVAVAVAVPILAILSVGNGFEVRLIRNTKGKLLVTRQSWYGCIPFPRRTINLRTCDSLRIGGAADDSFWHWFSLSHLLVSALSYRRTARYGFWSEYLGEDRPFGAWFFTVHLGIQGENGPLLFAGSNQERMREIVDTFKEVAGLRIERA
jgi:hypothetical protein